MSASSALVWVVVSQPVALPSSRAVALVPSKYLIKEKRAPHDRAPPKSSRVNRVRVIRS